MTSFTQAMRTCVGCLAVAFCLAFGASNAHSQAVVTTDQPDYAPLSTALFSGSGFAPYENVLLKVKNLTQPCNTTSADSSYFPFTAVADATGAFSATWTVCNCPGDSLRLRATGQSSGLIAYAYFTDAPRVESVTISPASQSVCLPTSGTASTTYSVTSERGTNGNVNGSFSVSGLPSGVTASGLTSFSSNGNSDFPSRTLTLTVASTTAPGTYQFVVTLSHTAADFAKDTATLVVIKAPTITCPANQTVNAASGQCIASVSFNATATGSWPAITYKIGATTITSPHTFAVGTTTVTATATNACGTSNCNFTVTVVDNQPPVISTCATNQNVNLNGNCGLVVPSLTSSVSASDNCGNVTLTQSPAAGSVLSSSHNQSHTVTITATDAAGLTSQCTVTLTGQDVTPPSIIAPADVNVDTDNDACFASGVSLGSPVISDNCAGALVTSNAPSIFPIGSTTVTWTVTDAAGLNTTATQVVNVTDNQNPEITAPASFEIATDSACFATNFSLGTASGSDNCGFEIENDAPALFPLGNTVISWTITDASGNSASATQTVTVIDQTNPTISAPADVNAFTNDGCTATGVELGASVTNDNCSVASVTNNAPSAFPLGETVVIWTVIDGSGNIATAEQIVTVSDNVDPVISSCAPSQSAQADAQCQATVPDFTANVVASDNCAATGDLVVTQSPAAGSVVTLGTTDITITVQDASNNSTTCISSFTVSDVAAPVLSNVPPDANVSCDAVPAAGTPTASDNCDANPTIGLNQTSTQTANGIGHYNYTITNTWTATDFSGNSSSATQVITVSDNTAPVLTGVPANIAASCDDVPAAGSPSVADNCDPNPTITFEENSTQTPNGAGHYNYTVTRTWTATDVVGNEVSAVQIVAVSDTENPTVEAPADVEAFTNDGCTATGVALGAAVAADNCDPNPTVTNDAPFAFQLGETTVTWTVTDASGNVSTSTQLVSVIDNVNPTIEAPADVTAFTNAGCEATNVSLGTPVTGDNCSVANVSNDAPASFPLGETTVTWIVTDGSGNTSTATQIVTVIDNVNPEILACAADQNVNLNTSCAITVPDLVAQTTASDNCSVTITQNPEAGTVLSSSHNQTHTVELTATDGSGNAATCIVTLTAQDVTAPVIDVCAPSHDVNLNAGCGVVVPDLVAQTTASDNCTQNVTQAPLAGTVLSSSHNQNHAVVITATDAAGNSIECLVTLSGKDVTAPEIACVNNQTRSTNPGSCSYTVVGNEFDAISFADNCSGSSVSNNYNNGSTLAGAQFAKGTTTVHWTVTDAAGNETTCSFEVIVVDNELPSVVCSGNIVANVNASGCKATVNYDVTFSDNCPNAAIAQTAGLASGSEFPVGVTVNTFLVTDASGNTATCSFAVTVGSTITVNAGADEQTFFGYSADQTVVRTAVATGGTAPYTYAWTLSRPLVCNFVNVAGDETFSAGSCNNNACPTSGLPSVAPSCSGSAIVTATLLQDAELCVTVTDAFGCTFTDCFLIKSEDARCFAGNSNVQKVNICHKTNSAKNPWVQICIAQPAVATHLAENTGDYVGMCGARMEENTMVTGSGEISFAVYPNPTRNNVNVEFVSDASRTYSIALFDVTGRMVMLNEGNAFEGGNRVSFDSQNLIDGMYLLRLTVGEKTSTVRLVVAK